MANKDILALPEETNFANVEWIKVVTKDGDSRKFKASTLKTGINTDPTVVPSSVAYRGARVRLSADQTHNSSGNYLTVTWATAAINTDSIWSIGAPTRLTVPTGVTKVRLSAAISWQLLSATGFRAISLNKNGAIVDGGFGESIPGSTIAALNNGVSSVLSVTAGDYFELRVYQNSGTNLNMINEGRTWFAMEVIEATI